MHFEAYEIKQDIYIDEIRSRALLLRHKRSGARVSALINDDENKVFVIGFRTPPSDDTGAAHMVEHTVLCGSGKYPIKDPFIELEKGTLHTYLNAITYGDKTIYPVASYNDKDFADLCDVYLDAVFDPLIHKSKMSFLQEGWRYEPDGEGGLRIGGVVYNEMKGAYSQSETVLGRESFRALFPDTAYRFDSGGFSPCMDALSYEDFKAFHRAYYHPSNSYICFYGNMDIEERLESLDRDYLSKYEKAEIDTEIRLQEHFDKMKCVRGSYPAAESDDDGTYLSVSFVTSDRETAAENIAWGILGYVLTDPRSGILRKELLDRGIGSDVYTVYEDDMRQPVFSVTVQDAEAEQAEEFLKVTRETLEKLVKDGIPKRSLQAAIKSTEFSVRESDFGTRPKGLVYITAMFKSWLYDDEAAFDRLKFTDTFAELYRWADCGGFEKLIKEKLLDNSHSALVTLTPDPEL
ncbi:MAG: insulinase family protein, partial [Lachnospiraceae bacterium]|nr:insulinase family protein [Lachnospiraceae bacterium]